MPRTTRAAAKAVESQPEGEDTTETIANATNGNEEDQASPEVAEADELPVDTAAPAKKSKSKKKGSKKKKAKANVVSPDIDAAKEEEEQDDVTEQIEGQDAAVREPDQQADIETVKSEIETEPPELAATVERPGTLEHEAVNDVEPSIGASPATKVMTEQDHTKGDADVHETVKEFVEESGSAEKDVKQDRSTEDPVAKAPTVEEPEVTSDIQAETQVADEPEAEPVETIEAAPAIQDATQPEPATAQEGSTVDAPNEEENTEVTKTDVAAEHTMPGKASPKPKVKPTTRTLQRPKPVAKADAGKSTITARSTASRPSMPASRPVASKLSQSTSTRPKSGLGEQKANPTDKPADYLAAKRRPISMQFPTPPPPPRSSKPATKPSFTLPGDAIAAKLKAAREERLGKEAENDKKKKEFHARPVPASNKSAVPSVAVKQTAASKARMSIAGGSDKENAPSDTTTSKHVSKPSTASKRTSVMGPPRPSTSTISKRASVMGPPAAPKPRITSLASSVSSVGPRPVKGKEVFSRDRIEKDTREKERKEKEEKTKKAREEAAERSRQMSREFREKQKRKAELANGTKKTEMAPPAIVEA